MKLFIKNISIVGFFAFMVLSCTVSVSANEYMDFEYEEHEYGIHITDYIGENKNVIVPNEINGKEVSSVYIANDNVEFIKFPDYMSTYDNIGFGKNVKGIMVNNLRYMDFSYLKNSGGYDYSDTSICKFFVTGSVDTDVDSWSVVPDKIQNAVIYSGCEIKNDFIYSSGCENKNNFYSSGLVDYIGENKKVTITETDLESVYMRLGDYAFYNNDIIESVYFKFEDSDYAQPGVYNFYNCKNLKEVYGLFTLDSSDVFLECENLVRSYFGWIGTVYTDEWIYLPNPEQPTNASIVGYLGEDTNIAIPSYIDGYKITGFANVFEANTTVTDVTMPDTITILSRNAFKNCEALKSIKLSENIDVINKYSFFGCNNLTKVKIPDKVKSIYSFAFCNSGLSEITLPTGLERIAEYAFVGTKLSEIFIPSTVSSLDSSAFQSCENLSEIHLPLKLEGQKNSIKPNSSTNVKIYCCVNYYVDDKHISTEYVTKNNSATVEEYLPESYIDNYILLVNNEIWDKQNVNENLNVIVKSKYYTVTYSGAINEEQTVEYMQDAILPVCEDNGYEFRFKYNSAVWDGKAVTDDMLIDVEKICTLSELDLTDSERVIIGNRISLDYYENYYPLENIVVSENATYKLYNDSACSTEITELLLNKGINTFYVKVIAENGNSTTYTLIVNRNIPDTLGEIEIISRKNDETVVKLKNKLNGNPTIKLYYGEDANSLSNEAVIEYDKKQSLITSFDDEKDYYICISAIYDDITVYSNITLVEKILVIDIAKQYCFNDSGKCFYQFNLVANKKTDATVIVALYDDNYRMLDILTKNLQLSSEAKSISERPTVSNATKYKVFVWENLSSLIPLCEASEGKIE